VDFGSPHASRFTFYAVRSLPWLAVIAALVFSAMYFLVAIPRIFYPYDLDFLEDSMLMQSLRIAGGQPVYAPPNADFVPHVYMPLYIWLGGWLFKITGPGFVPLRLMSLAATIATAMMIYRIARRESGLRWIAIACAGLWLGGYRITDGWYELVRVDSLFTALSLGGMLVGVYADGSGRRLSLPAIVLALAFLTKQIGVIFAIGLTIYLLAAIGRRAWLFPIMCAVLTIPPIVMLNALTENWFSYYAFGIASSNPVETGRIVNYVRFELFGLMAGLSLTAIAAGLLGVRRAGAAVIREQPWLIGIGAAVIVSGMGRASVGGAMNNLMPVYALLCLAPALLMREWKRSKHIPALVATAILIQFALGVYNPLRFIPTADMRRSGDRLIERIASTDGEVFVMMHPYYAWLAGKQPSAQIAVVWHSRERGALPLPDDLARRIQSRYYAAIISDESLFETDPLLVDLLEANYVRSETLTTLDAPPTLTGMFAQPRVVYVPRR